MQARAEAYRRAASHLFRDSDDMLRAVHLAAGAQPLVSLLDDVSPMQASLPPCGVYGQGFEIGLSDPKS